MIGGEGIHFIFFRVYEPGSALVLPHSPKASPEVNLRERLGQLGSLVRDLGLRMEKPKIRSLRSEV